MPKWCSIGHWRLDRTKIFHPIFNVLVQIMKKFEWKMSNDKKWTNQPTNTEPLRNWPLHCWLFGSIHAILEPFSIHFSFLLLLLLFFFWLFDQFVFISEPFIFHSLKHFHFHSFVLWSNNKNNTQHTQAST